MKTFKGFFGLKILVLLMSMVVIFTFGLVTISAADNSHIYVNPSGNDSWNGQAASHISSNVGPKKTIKSGINTINPDGTLHLASGTYNERNLVISKNIIIKGAGVKKTIINGNNKGNILRIDDIIKVIISDVTFFKGRASYGGAIHNSGVLDISRLRFLNNSSPDYGGAIYNGGVLTEKYVTYTGNVAKNGGCVLNDDESVMSSNYCIFVGNRVIGNGRGIGYGGAIQNIGTGYITRDYFSYNKGFEAAAVHNSGGGVLIAKKCIFKSNTAQSTAGALDTYHGITVLTYCNFINNRSRKFGGAIYVDTDEGRVDIILSTLIIKGCYFIGNKTGLDGGAIHNYRGVLIISRSKFRYNRSRRYGGAISNYHGLLKTSNNRYMHNIARFGLTINQWL